MVERRDEIGIAVIGLGFMGRVHIGAFTRAPGCRVVAVVDRDVERFRRTVSEEGNIEGVQDDVDLTSIHLCTDIREVLEDSSIAAVSIATPTPTHEALAHAVIESGRHLLIEKPVDLDPRVIRDLARRAETAGVLAMPAHCMRFWPAWAWMGSLVREETYGACLRASFLRRGAAPDWNREFYLDDSKSGGAAVDMHIHDTDFILHCFGTPDAVVSDGSRRYLKTRYEYENGPVVTAEGGWLEDPNAAFTMQASLDFEDATVSFDIGRDPEIVVEDSQGVSRPRPDVSEGGSGYDGEVRAFISAIEESAFASPVTLDDAAETARVLQIELQSLATGGARRSCRMGVDDRDPTG